MMSSSRRLHHLHPLNNTTMMIKRLHRTFATLFIAAGLILQAAPLHAQTANPAGEAGVVEITATDHAFRAPGQIPSGWTTIEFENEGQEPHMIFMWRLPEGKTVDDYEREIAKPYNDAWLSIRDEGASMQEAVGVLMQQVPEWHADLEFVGGVGVTTPGRTSQTTVHLEPGHYTLECYMKTGEGERHDAEGMIRPLEVTGETADAEPPEANVQITLSNNEMDVKGELVRGERTIAVHFAENPEQGYPHNVHLARLNSDVHVEEVIEWMNAFSVGGMSPPAPVEFIGGVHMMPTGSTGYFTAELEPGRYLFISEETADQGVLHEFMVAD